MISHGCLQFCYIACFLLIIRGFFSSVTSHVVCNNKSRLFTVPIHLAFVMKVTAVYTYDTSCVVGNDKSRLFTFTLHRVFL
jgi:hypothetical protein